MPIKVIPGKEALGNLKQNPAAAWPAFNDRNNRLWPIAKPEFKASFSIKSGAEVFTMGSCFARNIENALIKRGLNVPTYEFMRNHNELRPQFLNLYSVASIYNELSWALDPSQPYNFDDNIAEVTPGGFIDLHLADAVKPTAKESVVEIREHIISLTKAVKHCDVFILTLGLVESWWDQETQRHLNVTPPKRLVMQNPDRFQLHVLDYPEVSRYLHQSMDLLAKARETPPMTLITVSPIPLSRTFTMKDVAIANTYSKSVLRTVAEEMVESYDFVDYFPSFESFMLSDPRLAWQEDRVHADRQAVAQNVDRMIMAYVQGAKVSDSKARQKGKKGLASETNWQKFWESFETNTFLKAAKYAEKLIKDNPTDDSLRYCLAKRSSLKKRWQEAIGILNLPDQEYMGMLQKKSLILKAECEVHLGQPESCLATVEELKKVVRRSNPSVHYLRAEALALLKSDAEAAEEYDQAIKLSRGNNHRFAKRYHAFLKDRGEVVKADEIAALFIEI